MKYIINNLVDEFNLEQINDDIPNYKQYSLPQNQGIHNLSDFFNQAKLGSIFNNVIEILPKELSNDVNLIDLEIFSVTAPAEEASDEILISLGSNHPIKLSDAFDFLPDLVNSQALISIIQIAGKTHLTSTLSGNLVFEGADPINCFVEYNLSTRQLTFNLTDPASINAIADKFGFDDLKNTNLIASYFNFNCNFITKDYSFSVSVDSDWKTEFDIGVKKIEAGVKGLAFSASKNGKVSQKSLSGTFVFDYNENVSFDVRFQKNSGANKEFLISGDLSAGKSIQLSDFIDAEDIPRPLQKLAIDQLSLNYSSSGGFVFSGTIADLFDWDGNAFAIQFYYSKQTKSFTAFWQKTSAASFDVSKQGLGALSDLVHLDAVSITFSKTAATDTVILTCSGILETGNDSYIQPTFNITVERDANPTSGNQDKVNAYITLGQSRFVLDIEKSKAGSQIHATYTSSQSETANLAVLIQHLSCLMGADDYPNEIPPIAVSVLDLVYDTATKSYSFSAKTGKTNTINLANASFDVDFDLEIRSILDPQTNTRAFTCNMIGQLILGRTIFNLSFEIAQGKSITAYWNAESPSEYLHLNEFLNSLRLDIPSDTIPDEFDLILKEISLELDVTNGLIKFTATTASNVEAFFVAHFFAGKWGFVFGLNIQSDYKPSQFPLIGQELGVLDSLTFRNSIFIISTLNDPAFSLASISLPAIPGNNGLLGQNTVAQPGNTNTVKSIPGSNFPAAGNGTINLQPGIFISFELDLHADGNKKLGFLQKVSGKDSITLMAQLTKPFSNSYVEAVLGSPFIIEMGNEKITLNKAAFRISLASPPEFSIIGGIQVPIGKEQMEVDASLNIGEDGIKFNTILKGETATGAPAPLPIPLGLKGLKMDEIDFQLGIEFEPPGVEMGLEGKFQIINQDADSDDFTLVVSLDGEVPNVNYFSAYIAEVGVKELVVAATGDENPSLPDLFNQIRASDLSLFWCEAPLLLPDGTMGQAGFGFNGIIDIFGFSAHAGLSISTTGGISGSAEIAPIHWGPLSLTGTSPGKTITQEQVDGNWIPLRKPLQPNSTIVTRQQQVVPPGGAYMHVSSSSSPFFEFSFQATLFNTIKEQIQAEISDKGLSFDLKSSIGDVYHTEISCTVNQSGFYASADFELKLDINLGPFDIIGIQAGPYHINTGLTASFTLDVTKDSFLMELNAEFWFDGFKLEINQIEITIPIDSLEELPGKIVDEIKSSGREILNDIIEEFEHVFGEAKELAEKIGKDAEIAAQAIKDEGEKVANAVKDEAIKLGNDMLEGIQDAEKEVARLGEETVHIAEQAAQAVEAVAEQAEQDILVAVQTIKNLPGEVAHEAEKILGDAKQVVEQIGNDIAELGEDLKNLGEDIANKAIAAAKAIKDEAVQIGNDIKNAAEFAYNQAKEFAKQALTFAVQVFGDAAEGFLTGMHEISQEFQKVGGEIKQTIAKARELAEKAKEALEAAGRAIYSGLKTVFGFIGIHI